MHVLLSLLDANLKLHQHAARALEKAAERRHSPFDEQAFTQAYLALRDVEVRELALLHQTALLAQSLKRETTARQTVYKRAEEWVSIFLAQHEALVRADTLFQALDRALILLDAHENGVVLKTFALAGDSAQRLREMALEEVEQARPRALAAALEAHRSKMRTHLTRLSNARRHFAAISYQHMPLVGSQ